MPDLKRDLSDIQTAEAVLSEVTKATKIARTQADRAAFSALLGDAPPAQAIATVMNKADAGDSIRELATIARESGDAAVRGMQHAVIDYAYSSAQTSTGTSFTRLKQVLEAPVSANEPSPIQMIRSNRLMNERELESFMMFVDEGVKIESALMNPKIAEPLMEAINPLQDLILRIAGSKAGTSVARVGGGDMGAGQGLIAASAGVRAFKSAFQNQPIHKLRELSVRAAREPEFMKEVLMSRYTPANRADLERRINLFLLEAGTTALEEDEELSLIHI